MKHNLRPNLENFGIGIWNLDLQCADVLQAEVSVCILRDLKIFLYYFNDISKFWDSKFA